MKYIKRYNLFESKSESIYNADWKELLPQEITILKDGEHTFKLGNVMKHSDMIQVPYENVGDKWGVPTLEFDFYFSEVIDELIPIEELIPEKVMRIDIDITWGDAMACEFYIDNTGKVEVIEYTSFHSKTDPSNTIFALDDDSLRSFVEFLNRFGLSTFDVSQFKFLDKYDNYQPN